MMLDCSEMLENRLWVGSYVRPQEVKLLKQMEITIVLSLQSDQDLAYYDISVNKLLEACAQAGIELRRIPIQDFDRQALSANISEAVDELEDALAQPGARIYMHCTAGINRGPTLAAAYLIKNRGFSAKEAYDFVLNRRQCSPYLATLEEYEASLKNE
jgi:protein-tyrosine phosphatase